MRDVKCEVVQDLMFSYCDDTLNINVKEYIDEHLNSCNSCMQRLEEVKNIRRNEENLETKKSQRFVENVNSIRTYILGFVIGLGIPVIFVIIFIIYMSLISLKLDSYY